MSKQFSLIVIVMLSIISCKTDKETLQEPENEATKIIESNLLPGMVIKGDVILNYSLEEGMKKHQVPGVSIAVENDGKLDWAKGYGIANTNTGTQVDTSTLFQAASISKPITALAILKLMEENKVDLDTNVNTYLKTWKVKDNKFTVTEKVTLRRLLTHTAGTNVHGFPGYNRNDTFPTTTEVLEGNGNTAAVVVDTVPGVMFKYSGGGYTIVQKVIEDITNMPFETYMDSEILKPLGMIHSTFSQPLSKDKFQIASAAYDDEGKIIDGNWHNYPEKAAAGLWTTPTDLLRYAMEVQAILAGKTDGLLQPETVKMMLTKTEFNHGLGPGLGKEGDSLVFAHGGKNEGYTNVLVAFANKGRAFAVMTSADNGGVLLGGIERSVSNHYNWGLSRPKIIEPISLEDTYLEKFTGTYKYVESVPSAGGDYIIKARIENNRLVIFDVPENSDYNFVATDSLNFVDIDKGDRIELKKTETNYILWWNNSFEFRKQD